MMADAEAGNAVWREGGTHFVRLCTGVTLAVEVVAPPMATTTTTTAVAADRVVVLVHGLAQQRSVWRETAEHLVRRLGCTCVLPDLRGHGDSTGSATTLPHAASSFRAASAAGLSDDRDVAQRYRLTQLADDLAALAIALLEVQVPVMWVGHSYGGNVLLDLAARHPAAVDRGGLVLVDGGFIDLQSAFSDGWAACLATLRPPSFAGVGPADLRRAVEEVWAVDAATGRRCWTDRGVDAMLDNFHTTSFNATTTTAAVAAAASTASHSGGHVFESVQPKLLFRAHVQLLEDLWAHRPCAALQALPRALQSLDSAPLTVAFVASPAPSPFSADKRADVVAAVRALLKGLLTLPHSESIDAVDHLCVRLVVGEALGDVETETFPVGDACSGAAEDDLLRDLGDLDDDEVAAPLYWVASRLPITPTTATDGPDPSPRTAVVELRRGEVAVAVSLRWVIGVGHEMPLQAPSLLADVIQAVLT